MPQADSVDIIVESSVDNDSNSLSTDNSNSSKHVSPKSIKLIVLLFFIFIFVISDFFVNNVVTSFGNTLDGRNLTTWGVTVQGIMLVFMYVIAAHMIEKKYI
jgi:hypothetical protein